MQKKKQKAAALEIRIKKAHPWRNCENIGASRAKASQLQMSAVRRGGCDPLFGPRGNFRVPGGKGRGGVCENFAHWRGMRPVLRWRSIDREREKGAPSCALTPLANFTLLSLSRYALRSPSMRCVRVKKPRAPIDPSGEAFLGLRI